MRNLPSSLILSFLLAFLALFSQGCLSSEDQNATIAKNLSINATTPIPTPTSVPQDIPRDAKLMGLGEEIRLENGLVAFLSSVDNTDSAYDWSGIVAFKIGTVPLDARVFRVGTVYEKEGIYFKVLSWDPYLKRARVVFRYRQPVQNR